MRGGRTWLGGKRRLRERKGVVYPLKNKERSRGRKNRPPKIMLGTEGRVKRKNS